MQHYNAKTDIHIMVSHRLQHPNTKTGIQIKVSHRLEYAAF